jgi:alcohol dehydrogenase class IV
VRAAQVLGGDVSGLTDATAREALPNALLSLMRDTDIPNGLSAMGFAESDISGIVEGALKQQRLLACSPRPVGADDLSAIVRASMEHW